MSTEPLVSGIIAAYRAGATLAAAGRSLLAQRYPVWPAMVTSDDGIDYLAVPERAVLRDARLQQVPTRACGGEANACNAALIAARGATLCNWILARRGGRPGSTPSCGAGSRSHAVPPEGAALVTGGGRRIGAHLVRALAGRGYAVAIHYRTSAAEAEAVAGEIERNGGRAATLQADLNDPAQLEALMTAACSALGPVTVLVNSAAVFEPDRAADFSMAQWDRQLAINLRAPVVLARQFARLLPAAARGLVVNLLDQRIATPTRGYFSYTLSKLALAAATELLAAALAPRVRVNGIAPGLTLISGAQSQADFERLIDRTPLGKGSSPDAIARALIYLLEADVVTGQILFVDGGRRLVGRIPDGPIVVGEPGPPAA